MANRIESVLLTPHAGSRQPELMLSAVLHLMSHYTARSAEQGACLKLAAVIERHLHALADLPGLAPVLQATCQQLSEQWAGVIERQAPRPPASSFLSRVAAGAKAAAKAASADKPALPVRS
ncbi:MAG: hypothetical protein V4754_05560 [Pseudomonadota bacterium]